MKKSLFLILILWANLASGQNLVLNFADLAQTLPDTGFWNGSDLSGKFQSSAGDVTAYFYNSYNESWGSWSGFAYSSWTNDTVGDYTNQYSTFAGNKLRDNPDDSIFAVGYVPTDYNNNYEPIPIGMKFSQPVLLKSAYVANTTYTALTIINGNAYASAFEQGDYFYLIIRGFDNGGQTGEINYYLADYRNGEEFVQKVWRYVDLSALGQVDSLTFELASSDVGSYGINTPTYFCIDEIVFEKASSFAYTADYSKPEIKIYPNPVKDNAYLSTNVVQYQIITMTGKVVKSGQNTNRLEMSSLPPGVYILRYNTGHSTGSIKIIKE